MLHIKRLVFAYFSAVDCSFDKEIFTAQVIHFTGFPQISAYLTFFSFSVTSEN